jgi:hypothetical protein
MAAAGSTLDGDQKIKWRFHPVAWPMFNYQLRIRDALLSLFETAALQKST